ncbi:MFS transporter [Rhodoluna limnophila]|uniref:MFS transporter n=1 Tax=Rhodoluna limnophila TaxID=232537 RepID=UPI001106481E|nr:MFS transporter [Rhodoluna limnophila]
MTFTSEEFPGWKKRVAIFMTGQTVSMFGSFLVQYAIMWHLTLTTKSGLVLALAAIFGFLPQAIVSIFAGVWADRVNRRKMIMISDSTIALSTLGLALLMLSGIDDLWLIYLVMAVRSVGAGVQMPAVSALLPQIVPSDKLMRINGINSSLQSALGLLAPVAAAAVYSTMSIVPIFFIDVVTAIIGVGLLATISVPTLERAASDEKPSYFADLKDGLNYIFTHDLVRWVMGVFAVVFLLTVAPSNLSPLFIVRNFGSEVWKLTVGEIAFSVGMALGGALLAVFANKVNRIGMIIGTSVFFGLLSVAMGFTTNLIVFYILFFIIGLAVPSFFTSAMTLLQETVEPERQGRVFGFVGIVISVAMPIGMAVLGPLADVYPVESLMIVSGLAMVVFALAAVLLPAGRKAVAAAQKSSAQAANTEATPASE